MEIGVIVSSDSRALVKDVTEKTTENEVYKDMLIPAQSFMDITDLRSALENPVISIERRKELVYLAAGGDVCEVTKRFVDLVLREHRERFLSFMATSYLTLYRKQKKITEGKLITASPVSDRIVDRMEELVKGRTRGTVNFVTEVDPSIRGGFILEYDTYRMDASVGTQLQKVFKQFKELNSKLIS